MSEQEQEREGFREPEAEVEGHTLRGSRSRGEAEAPEGTGERSEESNEADVEGHRIKFNRGEAEASEGTGERSEESNEADVEGHRFKF